MSFAEVMAELPALSVLERQILIRRALDLDEPGLTADDEAIVTQRLAEHRENPATAIDLGEMKARLSARRVP
jgi:hypothetical protein